MKCINCGTDNKRKDRNAHNRRCKNCGHRFAFEPTAKKAEVRFTDPFFAKAINDISVNQSLYFTPKQFLYFLNKRLKNKRYYSSVKGCITTVLFCSIFFTVVISGIFSSNSQPGINVLKIFLIVLLVIYLLGFYFLLPHSSTNYQGRQQQAKSLLSLGILILVIGPSISLIANSSPLFAISTILGMSGTVIGILNLRKKKPIPESFLMSIYQVENWLETWQSINGSIDKLLLPSSTSTQPVSINPEILNYSFDRVVVCQSAEIAQFLIANNFHFENNCAVLGVNRYPENIFDTVLQMLRQNPQLKVYALHNADPRGVSLINHLRTSDDWFANSTATIYDLGVLPRQVLDNPKLFVQQSNNMARNAKALPREIKQTLLRKEINWLKAGYFFELESFSPQHLLRLVTRGIALSRQEDALILLEDEQMTQTSVYAIQSFG